MRGNLRLGRWAGVPVDANIGVIVIVMLVGIGLAVGRFPALYPGLSMAAYIGAGIVAGLLLVLSILLHELSHAVVARATGLNVEGITLWLLGGVTRLRGEPRSPRADLAVAVVGPGTSLVLGGVFAALSAGLSATHAVPGLVVGTLAYLALANLVLGVFNLVPAAPLDGGRVLRALVWWGTGDRTRAELAATRAGRVFGFVLIGLGIAEIVLLRGFGGLWLVILGWFVLQLANAEQRQARVGERLRGVPVRRVMSSAPITATADTNVARFLDEVALRQPYSTYPLVDADHRLTGLVTLNRIRAIPTDQREHTRLGDIACPVGEVPQTDPDESVADLLPRMDGCSDGRAVALDDQHRVVGVVSPRDIARLASAADPRAATAGA
ncbi:site-2 protease family protein [Rhizomonospora bruguierae]|uniref:site-2 protease family protein n=1 Tax=Rhizomonospora bruguierae TaxID=1581705 RepID=UPI001BD042E5|nr:site-2 protease family protein [Micromonospora sp. NBRC 107566]